MSAELTTLRLEKRAMRWAGAVYGVGMFALALLLVVPTYLFSSAGTGLDPSVLTSLQLAIKNHQTFGKDFILTYGPLGYLFSRLPIGITKIDILLFDAFFVANIVFVLVYLYRRVKGPFEIFLILLTVLGMGYLYSADLVIAVFLLVLFHLHCSLRWTDPARTFFSLTLAAACSVLALYIKLNMGVVSIVIVLAHLAVALACQGDRRLRLLLASFTLVYLASLPVSAAFLHVSLPSYFRTSLDLIDSYNDAMYSPVVRPEGLCAALATIAAFLGVTSFTVLRREWTLEKTLRYGYTGIALFVLFKTSFVRGDHMYTFPGFAPIPIGFLALFARPKERRRLCKLYVLSVVLAFPFAVPSFRLAHFRNAWLGFRGYLAEVAKPPPNELPAVTASRQIPSRVRELIGGQTVDVNPQETSYAYLNHLNYRGRPVPQSYICNTGYLDEKNAEAYLSASAPEFIFFSIASVDDRYPFFDETKTKIAILRHYEVVDRWDDQVLLRKLPRVLDIREGRSSAGPGRLGQFIPLEDTADLQLLRANIRYSLLGKLMRFFFQPPELRIMLKLEDGTERSFRAIKPLVSEGLLVNRFVEDAFDANLFVTYNGASNRSVRGVRFDGPGWGFVRSFDWQIVYQSVEGHAKSESLLEFQPARPSIALPKGDGEVTFSIDLLISSPLFVHARGWAFLNGKGADGSLISVALRGKKTYVFSTMPQHRPDVSGAFQGLNLDDSGFSVAFRKRDIEAGDYGLWLYVKRDGREGVSFTNHTVRVAH